MPSTGSPTPYHGAPPDMSGGGVDPSYYYSLAPGGWFPGQFENWAEYQSALSRGTAGGNPDYDVPDWLENMRGLFGRFFRFHERNVQEGGAGQEPQLPGGDPYHFFSGPGAAYGPANGPGTGLVDFGRPPGQNWDLPEWKPPGSSEPVASKKPRGGGGGKGSYTFTPYQGLSFEPSFVDYQPIAPFTRSSEATRFTGGGPSSLGGSPAAPPPAGRPGQGNGGGRGNRSGGGGAGAGGGRGGGGGGREPLGGGGGGGQRPGGGMGEPLPDDPLERFRWIFGTDPRGPGAAARENIFGGVDTNALERGSPGFLWDPTTGILNTAGFPLPTPPARGDEGFGDYFDRLRDLGFDNDTIASLMGGWAGWGTGPVVRGENGYGFANAPQPVDPLGGLGWPGIWPSGASPPPAGGWAGGGGSAGGAGGGPGAAAGGGGGGNNLSEDLENFFASGGAFYV